MTCLVVTFNAPNGLGLNPQTVRNIQDCVSNDRTETYFQLVGIKEMLETTACGKFQIDAVDTNPAGDTNPDFFNTWNTLQVGEVVDDGFRVDLTGTFSNVFAEKECSNNDNPVVTVPTPTTEVPTPTTVSEPQPEQPDDGSLTVATLPQEPPVSPPVAPEPVVPNLVPLPVVEAPTAQIPTVLSAAREPVAVAGVSATRETLPLTGSALDLTTASATGIGLGLLGIACLVAAGYRKVRRG